VVAFDMHTMLTEIVLSTDVVRGAEAREHEKIAYQASARSGGLPTLQGAGNECECYGQSTTPSKREDAL